MARHGSSELERKWQRVIEQYRNSGLSIRAFCVTKRVSEPSFYYWQRRLRHVSTDSTSDHKISRRGTHSAPFVPLKIQPTVMTGVIELVHPRGHVLRLPNMFDVELLTSILAVLDREGT